MMKLKSKHLLTLLTPNLTKEILEILKITKTDNKCVRISKSK